ncbi:MAG: ATP-binding protein [Methanomicrobiaceae archaeon]|nr:ATP-binding protein [Methanomicrobiaceae archaeon]
MMRICVSHWSGRGRRSTGLKILISFTQVYQDIGIETPAWQDLQMVATVAAGKFHFNGITPDIRLEEIEIYADPFLQKVFYNIFDTLLRHGNGVSAISLTTADREDQPAIRIEDGGTGIPEAEKEEIFLRKYGKKTGPGLFLTREIFAITGIGIRETGTVGTGARFESLVPAGAFRRT